MTTKTAVNYKIVCPRCDEDIRVFESCSPTPNTEGVVMHQYWCDKCMLPWHVFVKNGKVVERDEF